MTDAVKLLPMPESFANILADYRFCAGVNGTDVISAIRVYAIQAVMQERERCAKLMADMDCAHRCRVGNELADAIRAQPEPKA